MSNSSKPSQSEKVEWHLAPGDYVEVLRSGTVVIDANILLDILYIADESERDEVLDRLASFGKRLLVPQQVRLEYEKNRERVRRQHHREIAEAIQKINHLHEKIRNTIVATSPRVHASRSELRRVLASEAAAQAGAVGHLDRATWRNHYGSTMLEAYERTFDKIEALCRRAAGRETSPAVLAQWHEESEFNPEKLPSRADRGKSDPDARHGDYVIWKQIQQHARDLPTRRPVVLVTDDRKEFGWMDHRDGVPLGAHPDLVREMRLEVGVSFTVIGPHHLHYFGAAQPVVVQTHEYRWEAELADSGVRPLEPFLVRQVEDELVEDDAQE